jgi:hypothetical protein
MCRMSNGTLRDCLPGRLLPAGKAGHRIQLGELCRMRVLPDCLPQGDRYLELSAGWIRRLFSAWIMKKEIAHEDRGLCQGSH